MALAPIRNKVINMALTRKPADLDEREMYLEVMAIQVVRKKETRVIGRWRISPGCQVRDIRNGIEESHEEASKLVVGAFSKYDLTLLSRLTPEILQGIRKIESNSWTHFEWTKSDQRYSADWKDFGSGYDFKGMSPKDQYDWVDFKKNKASASMSSGIGLIFTFDTFEEIMIHGVSR